MAQQSKTALTSRPLTKALGTASILSLAIAGANVANAIQTDIGVDYHAQFFAVDSGAFTDPAAQPFVNGEGRPLPAGLGGTQRGPLGSDTDTGFAHYLRVKADFRHEATGVSVHTVTQLAGERWSGDNHGGTGNPSYSASTNETVTLDQGYVRIPYGNRAVLNVGRQATSWNNCFLVCDDRRDRINTLFPTALGTVVLGYDRRADNNSFFNPDNGDMINAGLITRVGGFNVGLLWVHWLSNTDDYSNSDWPVPGMDYNSYNLQGAHIFSPYISGQIADGVELAAGFNWVGQNDVSIQESLGASDDGRVFTDNAWSTYLRVGADVGVTKLGFQYVGSIDGGLVSPGFDTYSSLLNNNPETTANPTSMYRMGGQNGLEDFDEHLFIARAGFTINPQFSVTAAVGHLRIDDGDDSDNSMVYDLRADYRLNEAVTATATWGMITKNDVGVVSSNSLVPRAAGVSFADDDLMAASLGLNVKF